MSEEKAPHDSPDSLKLMRARKLIYQVVESVRSKKGNETSLFDSARKILLTKARPAAQVLELIEFSESERSVLEEVGLLKAKRGQVKD